MSFDFGVWTYSNIKMSVCLSFVVDVWARERTYDLLHWAHELETFNENANSVKIDKLCLICYCHRRHRNAWIGMYAIVYRKSLIISPSNFSNSQYTLWLFVYIYLIHRKMKYHVCQSDRFIFMCVCVNVFSFLGFFF